MAYGGAVAVSHTLPPLFALSLSKGTRVGFDKLSLNGCGGVQ